MTNNQGKTVTIYDIPGIVKLALPKAINPTNIISGFQATGIAPFNRYIFTEADFLSSSVTDREMTSQNNAVETDQPGLSNAEDLQLKAHQTITESIFLQGTRKYLSMPINSESSRNSPLSQGWRTAR